MKKLIALLLLGTSALSGRAQFAPPAGQPGSTAIFKDSAVFIDWASACSIMRGLQDVSDTSLGFATAGDSSSAIGAAGMNGVVSLGDRGVAILRFNTPISNGPGWDFAVFENSFSDDFLELAFVEVSSNGVDFFRFPATSNTQDTLQTGSFGLTDATEVNNLAGKYRANYGTPFDLQELAAEPNLNINAITHVKIIDVVGSIQAQFASFDQFGKKINDPWSTPFASSGFDLDAVGVINNQSISVDEALVESKISVYPNPAKEWVNIEGMDIENLTIGLLNATGEKVNLSGFSNAGTYRLNVSTLPQGVYFLQLSKRHVNVTKKLVVKYD